MNQITKLIKCMPARLIGSYDPLGHRSFDDLIFLAKDEIDLSDEGQDGYEPLTKKEREALKKWIKKVEDAKRAMAIANANYGNFNAMHA